MHKRRRSCEMAALTITMLVSPITMTKGGGPSHCYLFFLPSPWSRSPNRKGNRSIDKDLPKKSKNCAL